MIVTKSVFQIYGSQVTVTYKVNGKEEYDQWNHAYSGSHQFLWPYLIFHSWLCSRHNGFSPSCCVGLLPPSTQSLHIVFQLLGRQSPPLYTWCNTTPYTDFTHSLYQRIVPLPYQAKCFILLFPSK